jgi:hypothetical protein
MLVRRFKEFKEFEEFKERPLEQTPHGQVPDAVCCKLKRCHLTKRLFSGVARDPGSSPRTP